MSRHRRPSPAPRKPSWWERHPKITAAARWADGRGLLASERWGEVALVGLLTALVLGAALGSYLYAL